MLAFHFRRVGIDRENLVAGLAQFLKDRVGRGIPLAGDAGYGDTFLAQEFLGRFFEGRHYVASFSPLILLSDLPGSGFGCK